MSKSCVQTKRARLCLIVIFSENKNQQNMKYVGVGLRHSVIGLDPCKVMTNQPALLYVDEDCTNLE